MIRGLGAFVVIFAAQSDPAPQAAPLGMPTVSITSPVDGTVTNQTALDVTVTYAAGEGRGNPHVTLLELFLDGAPVASFDVPAQQGGSGSHVFSGIPVGSLANTGVFGSFVARAFQGSARRGNSRDSAPVRVAVDTVAPVLQSPQPADGSSTPNATPALSASWADPAPGSGVHPASAVIKLDNATVAASVDAAGFAFTPSSPLAPGPHTVSAQVSDLAGNAALLTWSFTVLGAPTDAVAPVISTLIPAAGSFTNNPRPPLSAQISDSGGSGIDAGQVTLTLNAVLVPATATLQDADHATVTFAPGFDLGEGQNGFVVNARDYAGNPASASASFTVDRTPPDLLISDPQNGLSYTTATVALAATAADALAGLNVGATQVLLNSLDVTASVSVTPGAPNGFGHPGSLSISGTLTPIQGTTNLLRITVVDVAGNLRVEQSAFDVNVAPPPPDDPIVLTMVGGDGQSIRVGKASEPLRVRASYATSGLPVPHLPLYYEFPNIEDVVTDIGAIGPFTNDSGEGSLRYIPSRAGQNSIKVSIQGHSAVAPVTFGVLARAVALADASAPPNPCNVNHGTSEWAGSALPKLIKMKVQESDGTPVEGAAVFPSVTEFNGTAPPPFTVGYFMPRAGRTGPDGIATFAFVISPDAPMGTFTLRFTVPEFRSGEGQPLLLNMGGEVRDPAFKFPWSIDFEAGDESGQGQVGNPGQQLAVPLKTKNSTPRTYYYIIEGTGSFQEGDTGTNFDHEDFDGCGPIDCGVNPDSDGKANVRFTLGAGSTHALIGIYGATDIFAVGPPDIEVLSRGPGGGFGVKNYVKPSDFLSPSATGQFKVKVYAPKNLATPPTLDIQALTAAGSVLPTTDTDLAPTVRNDIPLTEVETTGQYVAYETAILSAFPGRPVFGDPVPSLPGLTFQVSDLGGLLLQAKAGNAQAGRHVSLVAGSAGDAVVGNARLFFENKTGTVDVKAVMTGVDKSAVKKITYDFDDGTTVVKEGPALLESARHTYTVPLTAAHRRDSLRIFVTLDTESGEPDIEQIDVRIALPAGTEPAPANAKSLQGLAGFNWNGVVEQGATPPAAFAGLVPNPFVNPPALIQGDLSAGGVLPAEMPVQGRRLIYKAAFPQKDGANPDTKIFELTVFDLRAAQNVFGSYVTNEAWTWSQREFDSLVRHHEGHVRDLYDARQQTAGSFGEMFRQVFVHYKTLAGINAGNTPNDDNNDPNLSLYKRFKAAFDGRNPLPANANPANFTRAPHAFLELRPWVDQFVSTDDAVRVSNRFLADSTHGIVLWFRETVGNFNVLGPGVLGGPKAHVKTQYMRLLSDFPEMKYRREFKQEYQLPEIKFK